MGTNALQTFLLLNAALVGGVIVLAVRFGMAHFKPEKHDAEHPANQPIKLPASVRQKLLEKAAADFEKTLENSVHQLQLDLGRTSTELNKSLESFGSKIIEEELKRYKESLDELQQFASDKLQSTKDEIETHKNDIAGAIATHKDTLISQMNDEIASEKQRVLDAIDARLADAHASFLIETLGHNVDLGSQTEYLSGMIEAHKDEFKKDVDDATTRS